MVGDVDTELGNLVILVERLHQPAPAGCPWCLEQTPESLADDVIKEAYEVAEAARLGNLGALKAELGDLLLLIVTNAHLANQKNAFALSDVINGVREKVVRRHPHVFGDESAATADEAMQRWDAAKAAERAPDASILDGIPRSLPAIIRAEEMQLRASRHGFDWPLVDGVFHKVHEEVDELASARASEQEGELGDVLFTLVNLARHLHIDPEAALQKASDKFSRRFGAIETRCRAEGSSVSDHSLDELDALWDQIKASEGNPATNQKDPEPNSGSGSGGRGERT